MHSDQTHKEMMKKMSNEESNQYAKDCIRKSFLELLNDKTFDEISVTAIIEHSKVARGTFYRNYSGKEDVLKEIAQIISERVMLRREEIKRVGNQYDVVKAMFETMYANQTLLACFMHTNYPTQYLFQAFWGDFDEGEKISEVDYHRAAFFSGIYSMMTVWFQQGMKESPEEMANYVMNLFGDKFLW